MTKSITVTGAVLLSGIVQWHHHLGGDAHCLARVHLQSPDGARRPIAVVSELRGNADGRGIADDFPAVADAVIAAARAEADLDPTEVLWLAHHGPFSYHYQDGPETFTAVTLSWDGEHYAGDLAGHRLLDPADTAELARGLALDPVPLALSRLRWRY